VRRGRNELRAPVGRGSGTGLGTASGADEGWAAELSVPEEDDGECVGGRFRALETGRRLGRLANWGSAVRTPG